MQKRIEYIDFLKFIGLTGIIIAHVGSPNWLMMLRSFDVPLMVIISSLLASYSIQKYNNDTKSILKYCISRFKRLVLPTWFFLTFYFILKIIITKQNMGIKYYLASFLLTRYGIGCVWIVLIYLYSALLIPLYRKMGYNIKSVIVILSIYIVYELLYFFEIGTTNRIIDTTFFYIVPYGLLTFVGYNYEKKDNKKKIILISIYFILFVFLAYYYYLKTGSLQLVQIAKYPPRAYYLSYGLLCSSILLFICSKYNFKIYNNRIICYISKHSMSIYLWHILILDIYKYLSLPELWYVELLLVYIVSIIVVIIINKIIDIIEEKQILEYLR